tara:strand:- start:3131 stop:3901 length:771 start_codon:yes stop_codon:yes gene_type:complete
MIKTIFMGKHSGGNNNCLGIDALNYLLTSDNFNIVKCILNEKDLLYDFCVEHSIDFGFDFSKITEEFNNIDLIISYGFKNLIKEPLISMPKIGCINFHPAPLPDWRGMGGVFNFALYEQVSEWGVSSHFVDNSFDTGDLIKVNNFKINSNEETVYSLNKKSHKELIKLFYEVMGIVVSCEDKPQHIPRKKQVGGRYISKSDFNMLRKVNEDDTADVIDRKIKAFFHPPHHGAFIELDNKKYSLINSKMLNKIKIEE